MGRLTSKSMSPILSEKLSDRGVCMKKDQFVWEMVRESLQKR